MKKQNKKTYSLGGHNKPGQGVNIAGINTLTGGNKKRRAFQSSYLSSYQAVY